MRLWVCTPFAFYLGLAPESWHGRPAHALFVSAITVRAPGEQGAATALCFCYLRVRKDAWARRPCHDCADALEQESVHSNFPSVSIVSRSQGVSPGLTGEEKRALEGRQKMIADTSLSPFQGSSLLTFFRGLTPPAT